MTRKEKAVRFYFDRAGIQKKTAKRYAFHFPFPMAKKGSGRGFCVQSRSSRARSSRTLPKASTCSLNDSRSPQSVFISSVSNHSLRLAKA